MELLGVAQKYQMDSVLSHIRGAVSRHDPPLIRPETAVHVYFHAQEYKLHQEVVQAARVTLRLSMTIENLGDKLDFPGMTGAHLHELWKYHVRVRSDLKSVLSEFRNSGLPDNVKNLLCTGPAYDQWGNYQPNNKTFPQWLGDYINSIAGAPHLFDIIEFENARTCHMLANSSTKCPCVGLYSLVRRVFWDALTAVVRRVIENVRRTDAN